MSDWKPGKVMLAWDALHRLVPSHFPPINLFESIVDPEKLEIAYAIESLTNDRLMDEVGDLVRVPQEDRISGTGSTPVMAAFTHVGIPSRFTNGDYGVYYGARSLNTAIAETVYHRERFLSATQEPDTELTMRQYVDRVALELHDIREGQYEHCHAPDSYERSQGFARELRQSGSNGIVYRSVRDPGGECVAAFKPKSVTIPIQGMHFRYVWSGHRQKIVSVLTVEQYMS
jgi:hypothetical protein